MRGDQERERCKPIWEAKHGSRIRAAAGELERKRSESRGGGRVHTPLTHQRTEHRRLAAEEGLAGGCCLRSERTLGACPDSAGNYTMLDHLCCQAQGGMYTAATSVLRNDGRKL